MRLIYCIELIIQTWIRFMINTSFRWVTVIVCSQFLYSSVFATDKPINNAYWWPNQLDLSILRHSEISSNPNNPSERYPEEFQKLDLNALIEDLKRMMTTSQDWWPADYGTYAPFFIRMAWHSAGTYRISDGRGGAEGGMQRFAPLNSWPDNANLDKARRLLWPIKQKYGNKISWSDLMVLSGNVALESMGFKTIGFAGGRIDAWEPEHIDWGQEDKWLASHRIIAKTGQLKKPYAATQMGLIYVNPEGPNGNPDPIAAAKHIRETFSRMAMNDEETVALIAGGHAFGKAHGAANAQKYIGPSPEAAPIEQQGLGWKNNYKSGKGVDTITSGLEGAWSVTPNHWSNSYLQNLYQYEWIKTKSPSGAIQWIPQDKQAEKMVPDAHDPNRRHAPIMFTTDLALKIDPSYRKISERFLKHPEELEQAFAKAWFKLMHRDMGPRSRYLGSLVPKEIFIWQDPVPPADHQLINVDDIKEIKHLIHNTGLTNAELIRTAWSAASIFRQTDMRGGANGARIRLAPQKDWVINEPKELAKVLFKLEEVQNTFNQMTTHTAKLSLADLIVLAGNTGVENAARQGGYEIDIPFIPGRTDATQEMTDIVSFDVLQPHADGFRNYYENSNQDSAEKLLVDKASMLNLSIPEMTVLVGGLRVLNVNYQQSPYGVLTNHPGQLNNDFFVNLLDMSTIWRKSSNSNTYEGIDRKTGQVKWKASSVDLVFGANSELRAVAEFYAQDDMKEKFINDFVHAWTKVMNADRFDIHL